MLASVSIKMMVFARWFPACHARKSFCARQSSPPNGSINGFAGAPFLSSLSSGIIKFCTLLVPFARSLLNLSDAFRIFRPPSFAVGPHFLFIGGIVFIALVIDALFKGGNFLSVLLAIFAGVLQDLLAVSSIPLSDIALPGFFVFVGHRRTLAERDVSCNVEYDPTKGD